MMRRREDGFVTVAVLGLLAVLLAVGTLVTAVGSIAVLRHRAASAADLAALAAAGRPLEGPVAACAAADRVARAHGAALRSCRFEGSDALVEVTLRGTGRLARAGHVVGRARAGPVRAP